VGDIIQRYFGGRKVGFWLKLAKKRGFTTVKRGVFEGSKGEVGGGGYLNNTLLGGIFRPVFVGCWGGTVENNGDRKHFCTKKRWKMVKIPDFLTKNGHF